MFKFNIQLAIQKDSTKAVIQVGWAEKMLFLQKRNASRSFCSNPAGTSTSNRHRYDVKR